MNLLKILVVPMALLATAGCSSSSPSSACGGGAGGGAAGMSCGDPTVVADPTALIDDMESPAPLTVLGANTGGEWWTGGDDPSKATGATITPDGDATGEMIPGGRCGSKYAIHVTGQGFQAWSEISMSFGWGSVDGGPAQHLPYDAHTRTGLTFWARIGDTSTNSIRLAVPDQYSADDGGICDKTATASVTTGCYDHFGVSLADLDVTWKQYRISFSGLSQQMFGIQRPSLDTASLYSIDFDFPTGSVFDFWVDDIAFY